MKVSKSHAIEKLHRVVRFIPRSLAAAKAESHFHVFAYGKPSKRFRNLMGSHNSGADGVVRLRSGYFVSLKHDRSGRRLNRARDNAQQSRLAGSVRPDQAKQPSFFHFEAHILHGGETGEVFRKAIEFKYGRQRQSSLSRSGIID